MGSVLFRGRGFSVERREYVDALGRSHSRTIVVHPGAVTIIPLLDDGRLVLIHNHRISVEKKLLELPAGTLDAGESPAECAARELEEETGYRAGRVEPLCAFYTSPGFCTERMWVFVATELTATRQNLDEGERIEVRVTDVKAARQMLTDGQFEDAKTIAALGAYFLRQERR